MELDLFSFPDEIGSGLAVFHPKGGIVRKELEDYSRRKHIEAGYEFVNTPHITKEQLYITSGHLEWYADGMFPPMHIDAEYNEDGTVRKPGQDYYLKPMNCPMHHLIYRARGRSYRELPLRLFEFGTRLPLREVRRDARADPGARHDAGRRAHLLHARADARRADVAAAFRPRLARRLRPQRFLPGAVHQGSGQVRRLRRGVGAGHPAFCARSARPPACSWCPDPGGAAFYGPKISVQVKDALGRSWQMSTIQLDFNMPDRFDLEYTAADGSRQRPVLIHRALFGSIERFFGVLTEHYAGAFPAWLAPVQVVGIPVADEHVAYLEDVAAQLKSHGVRVEVDASDDRMAKKIVHHTGQKVPFMLLAGDRDVEAEAVSFRFRDRTQLNGVPRDRAVAAIVQWITDRENASPTAELVKVTGR